jgi:cellulose synthase/poly-beta-1,6-N-acetylglucosamine synthase-like glycosyltransferase
VSRKHIKEERKMNSVLINYVFFISAGIPTLTIIIYSIIIFFYSSVIKEEKIIQTETEYPEITILIPSYNEEKIIEKRIKNILNYNYPQEKMRVIFIDDSNDSTPDIIRKYVETNKNIEIIQKEERMGYSKAVLEGLKQVGTDIFVLNEAGSFPRPQTLLNQILRFNDSNIGAVTGRSIILNTDERGGAIESLYLKLLNYLRRGESRMDTTFFMKGEATAYRTNLVKNISAVKDTGGFDTSMGFMVRKRGKKAIYSSDVIFEEYAPADEKDFRKQKMIRAANIMRNLIVHKDMLLHPKYGLFGLLSMPFYITSFFITPILLPIAFISMLIGLLTKFVFYKYVTGFIFIVLIPFTIFKHDFVKLALELELSMIKALYEIFFSKKSHDKIERVESTRR